LLKAAGVTVDQIVNLRERNGKITIEPVRRERPQYSLEELVAQCKPKKRRSHEDQEWHGAPPAGREVL
jgi:antitoxin ChpS